MRRIRLKFDFDSHEWSCSQGGMHPSVGPSLRLCAHDASTGAVLCAAAGAVLCAADGVQNSPAASLRIFHHVQMCRLDFEFNSAPGGTCRRAVVGVGSLANRLGMGLREKEEDEAYFLRRAKGEQVHSCESKSK